MANAKSESCADCNPAQAIGVFIFRKVSVGKTEIKIFSKKIFLKDKMNDKINIALIVHESNSPLSMISVVRIKKYFFRKTSFLPQFFQHDIILKTYNTINET